MNKQQETFYSMSFKAIGEMYENENYWKDIAIISKCVTTIYGVMGKIETVNNNQTRNTIGVTLKKKEYRDKLNELTDIFFGIFRSYATVIDNKELYESSKISFSKLKGTRDTEMKGVCSKTLKYATDNLINLEQCGMTQEQIDEYRNYLDGYVKYLAMPQQIQAERKTATKQLKALFKKLEDLFVMQLDNHMVQFKQKNPEFYSNYVNARVIYDEHTTSKSLMGKITDYKTGEPLQYVEVVARIEADNKVNEYKKVTTAKGNYQFKGLPTGKCKVTFVKNYYDTVTIDSEINPNNLTRLNVEIQKTREN
jgi:hypothetical protein